MRDEQKYHRGDKVIITLGQPIFKDNTMIDISPDLVGKVAIILYSYADRYGYGKHKGIESYALLLEDGSTIAWFRLSQLSTRLGVSLTEREIKEIAKDGANI